MLVVVQVLKQKKDDARRQQHLILNTGFQAFTFPNLSSPKLPHPIFFPTLQEDLLEISRDGCKLIL